MLPPRLQARRRLCRPRRAPTTTAAPHLLPRVGVVSVHDGMHGPPSMLQQYDACAFAELLSVSISLHLRELVAATVRFAVFP